MMPKLPKSPQEKKRLSLRHDRRNDYGENDKSSRKNIPRSRAISLRNVRRAAKMKTATVINGEDSRAELAASTLTRRHLQKGKWRKGRDAPLGEMIATKLAARQRRDRRKSRSVEDRREPP